MEVPLKTKQHLNDHKNHKEPSFVRITINGEKLYKSVKIEDTFGNLPDNYYNFVIQGICDH
jgi:hypothetical protein